MNRKRQLLADAVLLMALTACSHSVNQARAEDLIRSYLATKYNVKNLTLTDMGPSHQPGAEGAVEVRASFVVDHRGQALRFENQPFILTYNQVARDWEVNPSLTFVLATIQNRCYMQDCIQYATQHPNNPTWHSNN